MQNNEGWLTNLSPGVESQFQIPLANHLHHKEKRRLFKTLAYILRIPVCILKQIGTKQALGEIWELLILPDSFEIPICGIMIMSQFSTTDRSLQVSVMYEFVNDP